MKFNQAKWGAIQQRRAALHQIYRAVNEDWFHARDEYARQLAQFSRNYPDCRQALEIIKLDWRALSAAEIGAKLEQLRTAWPKACAAFNVSEGFFGKHALIELYEAMLTHRKLTDARDQAARNKNEFGACFNVLNDFAEKHGQGDPTRYHVAPDRASLDGGY
ncbi:hypothetical protein [Methylomicrobium sp. Wu6]|uniref:hypothetical protein n=1 Tax=Methylomicrobium sp. Wu6 TaxID=3107928 RepID=UPI002DD65B84|nr:hypothetical protein [Methylomicrobium sp. Wu6]MEC4747418.1 hypothetical protein [Methylomicrobium sp. Wu6]